MKEYIERQAVEEMLENAGTISDGEYTGYCTEDINLDNIPNADVVETIPAEWVKRTEEHDDYSIYWYECSNCKCRPPRDRHGLERFSNFCPDCGCEMEGPAEENY